MKLTSAQAHALRMFADNGPAHHKMYNIREDVFTRLWVAGLLVSAGFMVRGISEKGQAALAAYDAKKRKPND